MCMLTWKQGFQKMATRKINFMQGEYYHVYNRGVDKRDIFMSLEDRERFFLSMKLFNIEEPIGSIYEHSFVVDKPVVGNKLVDFVCFCLNPNHYHFLITAKVDNGIQKFMQRLGTGYTKYFNEKYKRNGSLFQGKFKAVHISSNEYLLHVSAYINLNDRIHQLGSKASKSSWQEYLNNPNQSFCDKKIILEQFKNIQEYSTFAISSANESLIRKSKEKAFENLYIED